MARCGIAVVTPASPSPGTDPVRRVTDGATTQHGITGFFKEGAHMPLTEAELPPDPATHQRLVHGLSIETGGRQSPSRSPRVSLAYGTRHLPVAVSQPSFPQHSRLLEQACPACRQHTFACPT
jgi:hypothetical protein